MVKVFSTWGELSSFYHLKVKAKISKCIQLHKAFVSTSPLHYFPPTLFLKLTTHPQFLPIGTWIPNKILNRNPGFSLWSTLFHVVHKTRARKIWGNKIKQAAGTHLVRVDTIGTFCVSSSHHFLFCERSAGNLFLLSWSVLSPAS